MEKNEALSMITDKNVPRAVWDYYIETRDVDIRNAIVEANIGLCKYTLKRFAGLRHGDDMFQGGMLGLISAVERYDPSVGKFSCYAIKYIWGFATNEKEKMDGCPPSKSQLYLDACDYWACNPWDSVTEVARHFANEDISEDDVIRVLSFTNKLSLQAVEISEDGEVAYEEFIGEPDQNFENIDRKLLREKLYCIVSEITRLDRFENKRSAIEHLYGLGECKKRMNASEYARLRGISTQAASQIDRNFLKEMQRPENKARLRKALGVPDCVKDCDVADYLLD